MSKTTLTFKISTITLAIIDISALLFFIFTLISVFSNKIILAKSHLVLLILTLVLNAIYVIYLVTYLIIHKRK